MDKFKPMKSVKKKNTEQLRIYATLRCYPTLSAAERKRVRRLCAQVGGEWEEALLKYLTTPITFPATVLRFCIPEGVLHALKAEFFRRWTWEE